MWCSSVMNGTLEQLTRSLVSSAQKEIIRFAFEWNRETGDSIRVISTAFVSLSDHFRSPVPGRVAPNGGE